MALTKQNRRNRGEKSLHYFVCVFIACLLLYGVVWQRRMFSLAPHFFLLVENLKVLLALQHAAFSEKYFCMSYTTLCTCLLYKLCSHCVLLLLVCIFVVFFEYEEKQEWEKVKSEKFPFEKKKHDLWKVLKIKLK